MNIQKVLRNASFKNYRAPSIKLLQQCEKGEDMIRVPHNAKLAPSTDLPEYRDRLIPELRRWQRDIHSHCKLLRLPSCCYKPLPDLIVSPTSMCAHAAFTVVSEMNSSIEEAGHGDHMVIACEDKDPRVLWGSSLDGLIARWFSLLSTQPRWKIGAFGVDMLFGLLPSLDKQLPTKVLKAS